MVIIINPTEQALNQLLREAENFRKHIQTLPLQIIEEFYKLLETAAKAASSNIKNVDPELRVSLCALLDEVLERIVDLKPALAPSGKTIGIYTPAIQGYRRWTNTELLKDKGLAGYMLAKTLGEGAQPTMYFVTRPSDYAYLSVMPGLNILYDTESMGSPQVYYNHLIQNYHKMDVLVLHGMYEQTIGFLDAYRKLRPDGKVYCGLDMNSYWMANIDWEHPLVQKFSAQCDVVATSCTSLRDALNRNPKVNFACRWLPNGFWNATGEVIKADAAQKENVILTVGRIGERQKNNAELLIGFAKAANFMPGWTLRLVGPIAPDFQQVIDQFYAQFPSLRDRVVFTGPITDKTELYREYARAKIFVLTSVAEGGTPNVYAEALFHGCMFVTSNIDAADDITGYGTLGRKYTLGNTDELAKALTDLSREADSPAMQVHISNAVEYARKYYDWNRNARKLAYMLYQA